MLPGVGQLEEVGVVLLLADDLDVEEHPRVGDTAELVALAGVGALDGRGDLELVDPAGDDVHLHRGTTGTPKSWMTSGEWRLNWTVWSTGSTSVGMSAAGAGRVDVGLVGEVVVLGRRGRVLLADAVVERPRPLLAEHLDGQVGVGVEVEHLVLDAHRVEEEHDAHEDRGDRVEDLERQVVARLPRHLVVAAATELHHGVEDEAPDDDAGHHGGDPGPPPELEGVGTLSGGRVGHRQVAELLRVGLGTSGQHQHRHAQERDLQGALQGRT